MDRSKLKLSLDSLTVDSFTTDRTAVRFGTVRAHDQYTDFNECGMSNPCTPDGERTIDAALCTAGCGEGTIGAATCARTGRCCNPPAPTLERTLYCCQ
jgi:hypothetical protein